MAQPSTFNMANVDTLILSCSIECGAAVRRALASLSNLNLLDAGHGVNLFDVVREQRIRLAILEDRIYGVHLLETIGQLAAIEGGVQMVVLSNNPDVTTIEQCLDAGASACIDLRVLDAVLEPTVEALRFVMAPPPGVSLRSSLTRARRRSLEVLSPREAEIFRLLAEGQTAKEIGLTCQISVKTVDTHRRNLMEKLGIDRIAQLTRLAIKCGVIGL